MPLRFSPLGYATVLTSICNVPAASRLPAMYAVWLLGETIFRWRLKLRTIKQRFDPPDPKAECTCGLDDSPTGMRYSNICPKHDGQRYDLVTEDDDETRATEAFAERVWSGNS